MPADLLPNEAIPELASHVDSPEKLSVLQRIQRAGFLVNGGDIDPKTAETLQQLTEFGLVDPGYEGQTGGKPFLWVSNGNGSRVLRYLTERRYQFHRRASTALNQLSDDEQAHVLETLAALAGTPPAQWPAGQAKRLPGDPPLYLVRVNDSLRVIVRVPADQPTEVLDIVRHETLEFFKKATASNGTERG